jgi:hypothetical protein
LFWDGSSPIAFEIIQILLLLLSDDLAFSGLWAFTYPQATIRTEWRFGRWWAPVSTAEPLPQGFDLFSAEDKAM